MCVCVRVHGSVSGRHAAIEAMPTRRETPHPSTIETLPSAPAMIILGVALAALMRKSRSRCRTPPATAPAAAASRGEALPLPFVSSPRPASSATYGFGNGGGRSGQSSLVSGRSIDGGNARWDDGLPARRAAAPAAPSLPAGRQRRLSSSRRAANCCRPSRTARSPMPPADPRPPAGAGAAVGIGRRCRRLSFSGQPSVSTRADLFVG